MPTLPLFATPADPDAWHHVTAPGGYEAWHFDAADAGRDVRVVVDVGEGWSFDPAYVRRYVRYRRSPTRYCPPVPGDCPFVYLAVYSKGQLLARVMSLHPTGALAASCDGPDLTIGASRLARDPDGTLRLHAEGVPRRMTWLGKWRDEPGRRIVADLAFRPVLHVPPHERDFIPPHLTGGAAHRWVIAAPLCAAEGVVRVIEGAGLNGQTREVTFAGRGFHDHRYGTTPLDRGVGPCGRLWGHAVFDDRAYVFRVVQPDNPTGTAPEVQLLLADRDGVREVDLSRQAFHWSGAPTIDSANEIRFGTRLRLTAPKPLDWSPYGLCGHYAAEAGDSGGRGVALCQMT